MVQYLLKQSRALRSNSTPHEKKLWYYLRANRFENLKFRRQCVVGPFIVDFLCLEKKIIIELDGGGHGYSNQEEKDIARDQYFADNGYSVLRVWNTDIDTNMSGVLERLREMFTPPHPPPKNRRTGSPLPKGEGDLLKKYDRPGPRYTSYPTAPEWTNDVGEADFWRALERSNSKKTPLSLYVHLPFCEEHCTFCGCSTVITKKRAVTTPYLTHLFREIDLIADRVDASRPVIQLHWGGGTPTYLSTDEIRALMEKIRSRFSFSNDAEVSVEVDPRVTTLEQLTAMRELGVNRISMGVQDFNPAVQEAVNRIQPESQVQQMIDGCRTLRFDSVNTDLIYGLPHQTIASFRDTVARLIAMQPDRVALFNFAYVPWMKKQQNAIDPKTLPTPQDKFQIYQDAIRAFTDAGYLFIGMDHFAKPTDEMSAALRNRTLARNFQGYTTRMDRADMISFGITAISDIDGCYFQNKKVLARYYADIDSGRLAIERGKLCTADDMLRRDLIMDLFCNAQINKTTLAHKYEIAFDDYFAKELVDLREFESDGLVEFSENAIVVTDTGRLFLRNIGMVFDNYYRSKASSPQRFSRTV